MTTGIAINKDIGIPIDQYIEDNIKLIWEVVHRFKNADKDDLFQEASIYFIKAYQGFKASKGFEFSTYAFRYMYGGIQKYLRDKTNIVHIPRSFHDVWGIMKKNSWNKDDLKVIVEEVQSKHQMSRSIVEDAVKAYKSYTPSSIDKAVYRRDDGQDVTIADMLGSTDEYGFY